MLRFQIEEDDLGGFTEELLSHRVSIRDLVEGEGGRQILIEDPSGNPIEIHQPER